MIMIAKWQGRNNVETASDLRHAGIAESALTRD
jgi:hypothetical protein